jgi:ribulose 1,5-bisphosphate carboxylase large subunit-like protein
VNLLDSSSVDKLWWDWDDRETLIRRLVTERLEENPPPKSDQYIIATYFFAFRSQKLEKAVEEISYHATSGVKHPVPGSLIEACSAKPAGVDYFDSTGRLGLFHVAFPLKMMLHADGTLTSTDLLHTTASAIIFDVYENQDARLVALQIPDQVIESFPGPAYGPEGIRERVGLPPGQPAFGTILKPTAGITPQDVEKLVGEIAGFPLIVFIKEDEDLYPALDYSPVLERTRRAIHVINQAQDSRGEIGLLFAPHITSAPHEILDTVFQVLEEGATAVMFSETWAGGIVRMVREATRHLPHPPAIYGHNAGIGVKTKGIWREVIDLLARLDGIDFRQTAPVRPGTPFLKPYGQEWEASENILVKTIGHIKPSMIVRAGALDQGNIGLNLLDAQRKGFEQKIMFLAGSAINSVKDSRGKVDPKSGVEAMVQALEIYQSGMLSDVPIHQYLSELYLLSIEKKYKELQTALEQRYPNSDLRREK